MTGDDTRELEAQIEQASSDAERAQAHFDLALVHDRAGRAAESISHYEIALELGVAGELRAQCTAWLANSLSATHRPEEAFERIAQARDLTEDETLMRFLHTLERRTRMETAMRNARGTPGDK